MPRLIELVSQDSRLPLSTCDHGQDSKRMSGKGVHEIVTVGSGSNSSILSTLGEWPAIATPVGTHLFLGTGALLRFWDTSHSFLGTNATIPPGGFMGSIFSSLLSLQSTQHRAASRRPMFNISHLGLLSDKYSRNRTGGALSPPSFRCWATYSLRWP